MESMLIQIIIYILALIAGIYGGIKFNRMTNPDSNKIQDRLAKNCMDKSAKILSMCIIMIILCVGLILMAVLSNSFEESKKNGTMQQIVQEE